QKMLSELAREAIPHEYEKKKGWNQKKRTWDGVHLKLDGLELKTKRKWKEANHGTWKRYRVEMINPDEELRVELKDFIKEPDGATQFQVAMSSRLKCFGQLQRWNRGVKLFSISADARANVMVKLTCAVNTSMDLTQFPPDILFHPEVRKASIHLRDFKLDRVSHAEGPLIHELGDALEGLLRDELRDRSAELVDKMNRQLAKHQDELRLSLHDKLKYEWLQPEAGVTPTLDKATPP
ncbi:MAG: hypothetical protein AAGF97_18275, partial [Planctomycetota bacterium]